VTILRAIAAQHFFLGQTSIRQPVEICCPGAINYLTIFSGKMKMTL